MKIIPSILFASIVCFSGCSTPLGKSLTAIQNNPTTQTLETDLIAAGAVLATKDPASASLAPLAVNGLTWLANGANPTAVTGTNIPADVALITSTVAAAVPSSKNLGVASKIASAYQTAMTTPGVTPTPALANAVLAAISTKLYAGVATVPAANAAN